MSEVETQISGMENIKNLNLDGVIHQEVKTNPLIIDFGKHRGKSIVDLAKTDFSYCKWLAAQPFTSDEIKKYITSNVNVNDYIMRWGKYKNRAVSWIKSEDSKYIEWLINNQYVIDKCPKLLEALKQV